MSFPLLSPPPSPALFLQDCLTDDVVKSCQANSECESECEAGGTAATALLAVAAALLAMAVLA